MTWEFPKIGFPFFGSSWDDLVLAAVSGRREAFSATLTPMATAPYWVGRRSDIADCRIVVGPGEIFRFLGFEQCLSSVQASHGSAFEFRDGQHNISCPPREASARRPGCPKMFHALRRILQVLRWNVWEGPAPCIWLF